MARRLLWTVRNMHVLLILSQRVWDHVTFICSQEMLPDQTAGGHGECTCKVLTEGWQEPSSLSSSPEKQYREGGTIGWHRQTAGSPRNSQIPPGFSISQQDVHSRQSHLYLKSGKISFSADRPPNITDIETLLSCCWQGDLLRDPILWVQEE